MCKRIFVIGMVLLLIVSLATGCGKNDVESETTPTPVVTEATATPDTSVQTPSTTETEYSKDDLVVELVRIEEGQTFVKIISKVTNNNSAHTFVKGIVKVILEDSAGEALKSENTFAVESDGLEPGASKEFEVLIQIPSSGQYTQISYVVISVR